MAGTGCMLIKRCVARNERIEVMNENEFFREVTLRVCGNLEIEEALHSCLQYLKNFMPLDHISLEYYDENFGAMRTIALATHQEFSKLDILTPLSEEAQRTAEITDLPGDKDIFIFEDPYEYAISREMLDFLQIPCTSLMIMLLKSKKQLLGTLVLITDGKEKYHTEHSRLLSLIKDPFVIALSNALKHR